jgi:Winged helix DNA-binding domain
MRTATWSWPGAVRRRLHRTGLVRPAPGDDVGALARCVCGVQAQGVGAAELGLGLRTAHLSRDGLRRLVHERRLLCRTYAMRGTAHLLASEDVAAFGAAMRALGGGEDAWFGAFGLTATQAGEVFGAVADALDGRVLARSELADALQARLGGWVFDTFDRSLAELAVAAAYAGVLAYGPPRGARSTFVRPDQWIPGWTVPEGTPALHDLVVRYAATYGPISHADLSRWLGIRAGPATALLRSVGDRLVPVDLDGTRAYLPSDDADRADRDEPPLALLAQYDCYVLGCGPLDRMVSAPAKALLRAHNRGRYEGAAGMSVVLADGEVIGVWERQSTGRRLHIAVTTIRSLRRRERGDLEDRAQRVADFLGATLTLSVG